VKVLVTSEHRFERTPDGKIWTQTQDAYSLWTRLLTVFDEVLAVARVLDVPSVPPEQLRADGPGVSFWAVPYYVGPWEYLRKVRVIKNAIRKSFKEGVAVITRNGVISGVIIARLNKLGYPYAMEVVADPYDVFSPGSFKTPLRPLIRWLAPRQLRQQCARACAVAYVTSRALQCRYPCPSYSVGVSNVEIDDAAMISTPREVSNAGPLTVITVGSLAHFFKAPDILIDAVAACVHRGLNIRLIVVGDGKCRGELETRSKLKGLGERVNFIGQLTAGSALREQLDKADLFILPSRQEGLPRAMVIAMARGLPCIGSTVGGIPELLPPQDLVPPNDAPSLAKKIMEMVGDRERLTRMSRRNWEKAKEYHNDVLQMRRVEFYTVVKNKTQEWFAKRGT
jgi:glycosyltransferase involved in cell wall biosynthesis